MNHKNLGVLRSEAQVTRNELQAHKNTLFESDEKICMPITLFRMGEGEGKKHRNAADTKLWSHDYNYNIISIT